LSALESNRLIEPLIRKWAPPEKNQKRFPFLFFLAGGTITVMLTVVIVLIMGMVIHQYSFKENILPLKLNLTYAGLVTLLYHLVNTILFYFKEYKSSQVQAEELKRFRVQAELQLVRNQVNPHFLFNNLNVLSALVMQNNAEANKFIEEFSKVYRYILNNHEKELVSLKTELHYISPYIFLLEKRFGEGLKVSIDIPDSMGEYLVIPAALQMLIENAIKHNIVSRNRPLHIRLFANGNRSITVSNNLQVKQSVENSTEIGLQNIIKRYQLVSEEKVMVNKLESDFSVQLPLIILN
jgi:LytS/YehU family sensor histidine kinase